MNYNKSKMTNFALSINHNPKLILFCEIEND